MDFFELRIKPTERTQEINGAPARLWDGKTPQGNSVEVYVSGVHTPDPDAQAELARVLEETGAPKERDVGGIEPEQWDTAVAGIKQEMPEILSEVFAGKDSGPAGGGMQRSDVEEAFKEVKSRIASRAPAGDRLDGEHFNLMLYAALAITLRHLMGRHVSALFAGTLYAPDPARAEWAAALMRHMLAHEDLPLKRAGTPPEDASELT